MRALSEASLAIGTIFCLLFATGVLWIRLHTGCHVHDERSSLSPDGLWRATWSTKGCAAFLLTTFFDSTVNVVKVSTLPQVSHLVFESDSPDEVAFTWPSHSELHIEIPSVAQIVKSERAVLQLSISYSVQGSALQDMTRNQSILAKKRSSPGSESSDASDARYLASFQKWAEDYAQPPHP